MSVLSLSQSPHEVPYLLAIETLRISLNLLPGLDPLFGTLVLAIRAEEVSLPPDRSFVPVHDGALKLRSPSKKAICPVR